MAVCCGKERNTNFCPQCGKAVRKDAPLDRLLRYVRGKLSEATKRRDRALADLKRAESLTAENYDESWGNQWELDRQEYIRIANRCIASAERGIAMWEEWEEALIKVLYGE